MSKIIEVLKSCPEGSSPEYIAEKLADAGLLKESPDEEPSEGDEREESPEDDSGEPSGDSDTPELDAVTDSPKAPPHSDESYMDAVTAALDEMKAKAKK